MAKRQPNRTRIERTIEKTKVVYSFYVGRDLLFMIGPSRGTFMPPYPSEGEFVMFDEIHYRVLSVTFYYEDEIEIAINLEKVGHWEERKEDEEVEESVASEEQKEPVVYQVPLDAQGNCAYCHDSQCPGGKSCDFWDGSFGDL